MIKILIVDDHYLFNDGLKHLLEKEYNVVAQVYNGREVLFQVQYHFPDLTILDINLPGITGLEIGKTLKIHYPNMKLIFLSMYRELGLIKMAKDLGANGYFYKDSSGLDILGGIKKVLLGEDIFELETTKNHFLHTDDYFGKNFSLSKRELEVIGHIKAGLSSESIATKMCLSYETIKSHRKNIFYKLKINKVSELIAFAITNGI